MYIFADADIQIFKPINALAVRWGVILARRCPPWTANVAGERAAIMRSTIVARILGWFSPQCIAWIQRRCGPITIKR